MTNLYAETLAAIEQAGKTPADIVFIGSVRPAFGCTWDAYTKLADFEYDSGYGSAEIPGDLVIVFSDNSWLERGEYDGSEWWSYCRTPSAPAEYAPITTLDGSGTYEDSLAAINSPEADQ